eukprot:CAMPEP_0175375630 /NCGR_PEP_ID=MMETSP0095-20121207/23861_1 /TAXON_ID=311494 /ORGANISM="Alexandrium monilatum, Strain CCMP3105" /LENGTH=188 /DNA_ID=CAMNT_0016673893 /DNA_START=417 /DNA_END=978 /DNA_ORIENTATION=+
MTATARDLPVSAQPNSCTAPSKVHPHFGQRPLQHLLPPVRHAEPVVAILAHDETREVRRLLGQLPRECLDARVSQAVVVETQVAQACRQVRADDAHGLVIGTTVLVAEDLQLLLSGERSRQHLQALPRRPPVVLADACGGDEELLEIAARIHKLSVTSLDHLMLTKFCFLAFADNSKAMEYCSMASSR